MSQSAMDIIARLEKQFFESRANVNNLATLLEFCDAAKATEHDFDVAEEAVHALSRAFAQLQRSGDLSHSKGVTSAAQFAYKRCAQTNYRLFIRTLLRLMLEDDPPRQRLGLRSIMDFVGTHSSRGFDDQLFMHTIRCLVHNRNLEGALFQCFIDEFLANYDDVRHYTCWALRQLSSQALKKLSEQQNDLTSSSDEEGVNDSEDPDVEHPATISAVPPSSSKEGSESAPLSSTNGSTPSSNQHERLPSLLIGTVHRLTTSATCRNIFSLLANARPSNEESAPVKFMPATTASITPDSQVQDKSNPKKRRKTENGMASSKSGETVGVNGVNISANSQKGNKLTDPKSRKRVYADAWLALLKMPLPYDVFKNILVRLHRDIMPYMPSPLQLSDFLTDSYNAGGIVSILALNGLFLLISRHNLDYPSFYPKLYALLDASVFHVTHRVRFFKLLDLFLTSSLLPAYLVAAFIKRLARLCLTAPPSGCCFALCFIYNLLLRHPSCRVLIHRPPPPPSLSNSDLLLQPNPPAAPGGGGAGFDPYLFSESDPAKCRALESSLWELDAMRQHFSPEVARMVAMFEIPFGRQELDMDGAMHSTYRLLFEKETKKKYRKQIPLSFTQPAPLIKQQA